MDRRRVGGDILARHGANGVAGGVTPERVAAGALLLRHQADIHLVLVFHIGGETAEYVRVSNIRDQGDGWFGADVEVRVGAFRGAYRADFNSSAFSQFHAALENLYKTVSGSAVFTSYEGQLELTLTCDATGQIEVQGRATDVAGIGNQLSFDLHIDQTYVPAILRNLGQALQKHPPRRA